MRRSEQVLTVVIFVIVALLPLVSGSYFILRTSLFTGIYALVAIGLSLLVSYAGQVSIGHAGFMAIGAYVSAILTTRYSLNPWFAMVVAAAVTLAISYVIAVACLRLTGHYLAMATLGLGLIVNSLLVQLSSVTGGVRGIAGVPTLSLFGHDLGTDRWLYYLVWAFVLVATWLSCNLANSSVGRALKAIRVDEIASLSFGIDIQHYKIVIFLYSTALASIAGSLMAHTMTFISPEPFSLYLSILLLLMALLGGGSSPLGGILGAVFVSVLPQVLRGYEDLSGGIFGLLLILIMLFLPGGILSIYKTVGRWGRQKGVPRGGMAR
jgi:branched-chain amino acid transport system permease protein